MDWKMLIPIGIQAIFTIGALLLMHKPPYTKKEIIGIHLIFWGFVIYAGWTNFSISNNPLDWVGPIILGLFASLYSQFSRKKSKHFATN